MEISDIVVIRPGVKRITLQRTICSKIAYRGETTLEEIHVLFQNQLWLEQKCSTDGKFAEKFGNSLEELSLFLKQTNLSRGLTEGAVGSLGLKLKTLGSFLHPRRNLPQMESMLSKSFYTRPYKESGIPTKYLPPKKVIGRGYRDHGTAQNSAIDGSPKWQEVASRVSELERIIHEEKDFLKQNIGGAHTRLRSLGKICEARVELERIRNS